MGVLQVLASPPLVPRVGTVISVAGSVATVDVGGTEVEATIPSQPAFTLVADDMVYVMPYPGTWLIFAVL
jgi:hypothetical protein